MSVAHYRRVLGPGTIIYILQIVEKVLQWPEAVAFPQTHGVLYSFTTSMMPISSSPDGNRKAHAYMST